MTIIRSRRTRPSTTSPASPARTRRALNRALALAPTPEAWHELLAQQTRL